MFQRFVLALGAIVAAYISFRALSAPEDVLSSFGIIVDGVNARNEIRGQYGGFFGLVAVILGLSLMRRVSEKFGLTLLLIAVGGVLLGRLFSLFIEGPSVFLCYSEGIKAFIFIDIILVVLTALALRKNAENLTQPVTT